MIYATFSDREIEVFGDAAGLRRIAQFLKGDISALEFEVNREQRHSLNRIELRQREGQLCIEVECPTLVITGEKKLFPLLAQSIEFLIENNSPYASNHLHIESVPDHYYLSEHSSPVLFTKIDGDPWIVSPH